MILEDKPIWTQGHRLTASLLFFFNHKAFGNTQIYRKCCIRSCRYDVNQQKLGEAYDIKTHIMIDNLIKIWTGCALADTSRAIHHIFLLFIGAK